MKTKVSLLMYSVLLCFGILCLGTKLTASASTLPVEVSMYDDSEWSYEYTTIDYGYELLTSAMYHNQKYTYLYNDTGTIIGMLNSEGEQIVKYEYDINALPAHTY